MSAASGWCLRLPALFAALILVLTSASCSVEPPIAVEAWAANTAPALASTPTDTRPAAPQAVVRAFYAGRGDSAPLWTGSPVAEARSRALLQVLAEADREGLEPVDYRLGGMPGGDGGVMPWPPAAVEIELSSILVRYAQDVHGGRIEAPSGELGRPRLDAIEILSAAAAAPDLGLWLASLPPQTDRYARLRTLLAELRAVAARGGWTEVPATGKLDRRSDGPVVQLLRQRLIETGDLSPDRATGSGFDAAVEQAVARYQVRHGLEPDGVVGQSTLAALAVPVERRIEQVIVNMERRRYFPADLGRRYAFVNIADFEVKIVETGPDGGEQTIFTSPVVVGTSYHQTPIFAGEISHVIVNPYWHVPRSIAVDELLPQIKRDPRWLGRNDYTLWTAGTQNKRVDPATIDWSTIGRRSFPYLIRQEPGDDNALGRVKIMFPNRYDVYMHDTPQKSLFGRTTRTFSHGCIRVGKPFELAASLLEPKGISLATLEGMTAGPANRAIRLAEPIPVYVTYLTTFVNKDGTVHFRPDPYARDGKVLQALRAERG